MSLVLLSWRPPAASSGGRPGDYRSGWRGTLGQSHTLKILVFLAKSKIGIFACFFVQT
jgi:hypothetical protein